MSEKTFWNGEPCEARQVSVTVGKALRPTWWCAELEGQQRKAVEVRYGESAFYIDNENGSGWAKVTKGKGSPHLGHSSLPDSSTVVPEPTPKPTDGPPSEAGRAATDEEIKHVADALTAWKWTYRRDLTAALLARIEAETAARQKAEADLAEHRKMWELAKVMPKSEMAEQLQNQQKTIAAKDAEIVRLREENAQIMQEMRRCHEVCGGVIDRGDKTIAALVEALKDAGNELRFASEKLLEFCFIDEAAHIRDAFFRIDAALHAAKEGGK